MPRIVITTLATPVASAFAKVAVQTDGANYKAILENDRMQRQTV